MTLGARTYLHRHSSFVKRQACIEKQQASKTKADSINGYAGDDEPGGMVYRKK